MKACSESCRLFRFVGIELVQRLGKNPVRCYLDAAMNKAFTKDPDPDNYHDDLPDPTSVPLGKNYITSQGYHRLKVELFDLIDNQRPKVVDAVHWAASNGDRSENGDYIYGKKRLREIDRRIRFLTQRLKIAEIINPATQHGNDQIFFGATVTYADAEGRERTVTILGVDETFAEMGQISWMSPVANALLKARLGETVTLMTPQGMQLLEVLNVQYPTNDGKAE